MSETNDTPNPEKKSVGGDMIIPAAAVGFTLYYFSTIIDSPWEAQVNAFFIGTILIALVAVIVATSVWAAIKGEVDWGLENLISPSGFVPKRLALLALTFGVHFVDLDLDGYVDLVAANGHIEPEINAVQQDITFAQKPKVRVRSEGRVSRAAPARS